MNSPTPLRAAGWTFALAFVAAFPWCVSRGEGATTALFVARYALLLPAIVCLLWAGRGGGSSDDERPDRLPELLLPSVRVLLPACLIVALPVAYFIYRAPATADESAYLFQSRIFASGRLAAEAPPGPRVVNNAHQNEFFFVHHVVEDGRWFGKYPPGWPAALAPAVALGAEWLVNPLLGLLLVWLTSRLGALCYGGAESRAAPLVLLLSPMFFVNCFGFLSHVLSAVLLAAAAIRCLRLMREWRLRDAWLTFLFVGAAALVRPYTALCFGAVLGAAALWAAWPRKGRLAWQAAAGVTCALAAFALTALYNRAQTGNYLRSTYAAFDERLVGYALNLPAVLLNLRDVTPHALVKSEVALAPFAFLLACLAFAAGRGAKETRLLAALAAVLVVGHVITPDPSDTVVGDRYYFESLPALAVLAARGWRLARERFRFPRGAVAAALAVACSAQALSTLFLWHGSYRRVIPFTRVQEAATESDLRDAVVYLKSSADAGAGEKFPAADLNLNEADWRRAPRIYLPDPGPERRASLARLLGRARWVVFAYEGGRAGPVAASDGSP